MGAQFIHFDEVAAFTLTTGVEGRPLFGDAAMVNLIEFSPGATVPAHSHPHEQLGIVLRGMQALVVDGVARELGPMEGYVLPGARGALGVLRAGGRHGDRRLLPRAGGLPGTMDGLERRSAATMRE